MPQRDVETLARALRELSADFVRSTRTDLLSRTAASTLSWLDRAGATRITTLAQREAVTQPAMTGLVQRLESAGHVVRRRDPRDGRVVLIEITAEGRQALRRRQGAEDAIITERLAALSPDEIAAIQAALPALAHVAQELENAEAV